MACALVGDPDLLFLDEPTTGLDPQSRRQLWELVIDFRSGGGTVLITTHYMEEAERLCDRVGIVDHGKMIALGTPRELIASLGGQEVVEFSTGAALDGEALGKLPGVKAVRTQPGDASGGWALTAGEVHVAVPALLAHLASLKAPLSRLSTHHATLEDVFVTLTEGRPVSRPNHPLWQLTLTRWRSFFREPSAVFWTFGFPIVKAVALGIAPSQSAARSGDPRRRGLGPRGGAPFAARCNMIPK